MKIDVSIPVYNEGGNIEKTLRALDSGSKDAAGAEFSINIIYDFPEDDTLPVVEKIKKELSTPVNFVRNPVRGVVNAIKTGFSVSRADYVLVTMADMSDDYSILKDMVKLAQDGADIVCPSRYMKGGRLVGGPFIKQMLSRLAGLSMHWLSGVPTKDTTNSYKLYRLASVRSVNIESEGGFEIATEIVAKVFKSGGRIVELPTIWHDRAEGNSKFKLLKWIPKYLKWYFYIISPKKHT